MAATEHINVVWFKRDLRLQDHEPLKQALQSSLPLDAILLSFEIGVDYPLPIVDIEESGKFARDTLWHMKNSELAQIEVQRILQTHVRPNRV